MASSYGKRHPAKLLAVVGSGHACEKQAIDPNALTLRLNAQRLVFFYL
jgi:hypothetical protein